MEKNKGSALLIALMLIGILMTLALGVSSLMMSTVKDGRFLVEKTRAWYAAESGLEHAMLEVSENAPGFEAEKKTESYEYRITASASEFPKKEPYEIEIDEDRFAFLHLNESVTLPLFRGSDPANSVQRFRVEYYLAPDLKLRGGLVDEDLDILRWKIFGIAQDDALEVMNEFIPMQTAKNSAESPSCVGTESDCWNGAKFYERTTQGFNIVAHHPIAAFLEKHKQNFLVLTNLVNVDIIQADVLSTEEKKQIANIRYRVIDVDGKGNLTLPSIKIAADGFSGETKQSLDLELKRPTFLPVFNYALYRTVD